MTAARLGVVRPAMAAWIIGPFALHPTICWSAGPHAARIPYDHEPGRGWALTHVPTGRLLETIEAPFVDALEVVEVLARLDWPRSGRAMGEVWAALDPRIHRAIASADLRVVREAVEVLSDDDD
jgi:hypothetical protein